MGRVRWAASLAAVGAVMLVSPARAATTGGGVFDVMGVALAPSATQTVMVGAGSHALWRAAIEHTGLADGGTVTDGSLALATAGDGGVTIVRARVAGGAVALVSEGPGCGERVFSLEGSLADVTAGGAPTPTGAGAYALQLTVRRATVFGRCLTYARTVQGTFDLG